MSIGQENMSGVQVDRLQNKETGIKDNLETGRNKKCQRCGKVPNHEKKDYLAKDVECGNCTYIGHYVVMCRTKM